MAAINRTGVAWKDEYMIEQSEVMRSNYRHEPSGTTRSGKEFCTVDGIEYYRADCYTPISPYGWYRVEHNTEAINAQLHHH